MIYALFILLIIAYSVGNAWRGSGKIKKVIVYAGFATMYCLCIYLAGSGVSYGLLAILAALSFAIDWLCNSFGWGDFFPHGRPSDTGDFAPARLCANIFYDEDDNTKNWQTLAMSFRFFLTFGLIGTPLLAVALDNYWYLLAMPFYMLSGLCYRLMFREETADSVRNSEYLNGALIGTLRGTVLFIVA